MSLYRNILKQALKISWRYKYLWFFGFFAFLLGNTNEYEIMFNGLMSGSNHDLFSGIIETGIFSSQALTGISKLMVENPLSLLILFAAGLAILSLFIFLIWLAIVSQVALVNHSAKIVTNKFPILSKRSDYSSDFRISDGLAVGKKIFWPILGLNAINKFALYLILILFAITAKSPINDRAIKYIIIFIIFAFSYIILSFIVKYAIAYIVIRGNSFVDSLKHGCRLFLKNWLISIEMAFILFFITFIVGLALVIILNNLNTVFLFLTLTTSKILPSLGTWLIVVIRPLFIFLLMAFAGAFLATFQISSWTNLFVELISRGGTSKIMRIFSWKDKGGQIKEK